MSSYLIAVGAALLLVGIYLLNEKLDNSLLKCMVDVYPCLLLFLFFGRAQAIFLLFCLIANVFIYKNVIAGGLCFLIAYFASAVICLLRLDAELQNIIWVTAVCFVPLFSYLILALSLWDTKMKEKFGILIYGLIALLPPLVVTVFTLNVGFLFLVIGDCLLLWSRVKGSSNCRIISDCFYFIGLCLVPVALSCV